MNSFSSGLILQCPKITDEKRYLKDLLVDIFNIFQISHVLVIDNPDLSGYVSRNCPDLHKEVAPKM